MKNMIISLVSSVVLLLVLIGVIWYESAASFSAIGHWSYESEGQKFEMVLEEDQVEINDYVFAYKSYQDGDLFILITEEDSSGIQSGQTFPNRVTLVFEIKSENKLEMIFAGYDKTLVLIRK